MPALLRFLANVQAQLTPVAILALITGDRTRAGMPMPNPALLSSTLDRLRGAHADALAAGALVLGDEKGSKLLCDLVRAADASQLAFLRAAASAWDRATARRGAELREQASREETSLSDQAAPKNGGRLADLIRMWGGLTAPQRLIEARAGLSHDPSVESARRWRALGINLANERDTPAAALPIAEALAACFEALPDLGPQLAADVEACRGLAEAAAERDSPEILALEAAIERAERVPDVLRRELTGHAPIGGSAGEVAALRSAFLMAVERVRDDRAWALLRVFTLKLHNECDMPEVALSLTVMMLASAHTAHEKIRPALLEQLEGDWRVLRRNILANRSAAATKSGKLKVSLALLDELISLEPDAENEREWRVRRAWVQSRITRRRVKIVSLAAIAAILLLAILSDQSGNRPGGGAQSSSSWAPTPPASEPVYSAAPLSSGEDQSPPAERKLGRDELRVCLFGELRLQGARERLQAFQASGMLSREQDTAIVTAFNNYLAPWTTACVRNQYRQADQIALQPEIAQLAATLREQGAEVIQSAWAAATPPQPIGTYPTPASPQVSGTRITPFDQGQSDRREWESWFASIAGEFHAGADWWAGVRSLKTSHECSEKSWAHGDDFTQGCLAAKTRLDPSDHRRITEPATKPAGTIVEGRSLMDDTETDALALVATEWFKASRRALRATAETAPTRMERERALCAYAERRVGEALAARGMRLHGFDGQPYSAALPVEPVNPEDFATEEGLIVRETIEPTVLRDGRVLLRGKVVLAKGNE